MKSKRLLLALAGGLLMPTLLLGLAVFLMEVLNAGRLEWLADLCFVVVAWPLKIYSQLFPPHAGCIGCSFTDAAMILTAVTDWIVYSLLTYVVLRYNGGPKLR